MSRAARRRGSTRRRHGGGEFLIVNVGWTPDSRGVAYQVQDREQTWLDLNVASYATREPVRLLRETSKAWVNVLDPPKWLKDGSFLWSSERTGFQHLYHYKADGTLIRQITDGKWEARTLHGVDEAGGWVYFSGTERSPIGSDVYRIKLDGSGLTRLSRSPSMIAGSRPEAAAAAGARAAGPGVERRRVRRPGRTARSSIHHSRIYVDD